MEFVAGHTGADDVAILGVHLLDIDAALARLGRLPAGVEAREPGADRPGETVQRVEKRPVDEDASYGAYIVGVSNNDGADKGIDDPEAGQEDVCRPESQKAREQHADNLPRQAVDLVPPEDEVVREDASARGQAGHGRERAQRLARRLVLPQNRHAGFCKERAGEGDAKSTKAMGRGPRDWARGERRGTGTFKGTLSGSWQLSRTTAGPGSLSRP